MSNNSVRNRLSFHFLFHFAPKKTPIMKPMICEIYATFPPVALLTAIKLKMKYRSAIGPIGEMNWMEYPGLRTKINAAINENMAADAPTMLAPG